MLVVSVAGRYKCSQHMITIHNFKEAHEVLNSYISTLAGQGQVYTLDRIRLLMDKLGNPQDSYRVVHVAGTSGKTSTSYFITSLLVGAGKKVGLTVSPHIDEINERVQINLVPLPEEKFCKQISKFLNVVNETDIKPSYFELLVAFAYWQFAEDKVDYAVIEVGLGGLLDGTNVVTRHDKVCVITDIGLDHTEILGKTLPEIAAQKAGIIHPQNSVFMHQQSDEVMKVVREVCAQNQAELIEAEAIQPSGATSNLPIFQQRNFALAMSAYDYLRARRQLPEITESRMAELVNVYIPARMETVQYKDKIIIMDGAHNAQKLSMLFESISSKYPNQEIAVLLSLKHTRGIRTETSLEVISKNASWMGITAFAGSQDTPYRSVNTEEIAEYCQHTNYENFEVEINPEKAFEKLLERPEPIFLVTGSFYLLNHIRPYIKRIIKA